MRIGLLANVGGHFDAFWSDIIRYFEAAGHRVYLAAGTPSRSLDSEVVRGISRRPHARNLFAARDLTAWAVGNKIDVVITNTATPSYLVRLAKLDLPVIYFAHGFHWSNEQSVKNLLWKAVEKALVHRTAGFVVINDEDEAWIKRQAPDRPYLRLKFGVGLDIEKFPRSSCTASKDFVWIGEMSERKRPLEAIEAMRIVSKTHPDSRLFMLGRGKLAGEVHNAVGRYGLEQAVVTPGLVSPEPHITRSVALLHTAKWEGLPRVALEALAVGRPVVGYRIKGLTSIPGALLSPDGDVQGLARSLVEVLESPGRYAIDVDPRELSWEVCAESLLKFAGLIVGPR